MNAGTRIRPALLVAAVMGSTLALAGPDYTPDLVVELRIEPVTPMVGETIRVVAKIENQARVGAGASTLVVQVEGDPRLREFEVGPLAPQDEVRFEFEHAFPIPGRFRIVAEADVGNRVIEAVETNNTTVASVLVQQSLGVDRGR